MENGVANHVFDIMFIIKLAAIIVPLIGISFILRNLLGADKKKWFSYNHINDFHKKGDSRLRGLFIILILASLPWTINKPLAISAMVAIFTVVLLGFQAFAEWKFSSNRQNFKVSLVEIGLFLIALLGVVFWFS
ncbi:DUF4181 domain-containing protein [Halobacillus sp. B29]|uniref:DUF4181 domain-containing protein n=1 Tax=Halobacillus sp. B29 TaxID=3457432 RepID=UPI003FCED17B